VLVLSMRPSGVGSLGVWVDEGVEGFYGGWKNQDSWRTTESELAR